MTANGTAASTLLVAIDISKHRHEVLIGIPGKKRRRRLTITNTLDDFQRLAAALSSHDLPVRIRFEATGNDHRPLAHHLDPTDADLPAGIAQQRGDATVSVAAELPGQFDHVRHKPIFIFAVAWLMPLC